MAQVRPVEDPGTGEVELLRSRLRLFQLIFFGLAVAFPVGRWMVVRARGADFMDLPRGSVLLQLVTVLFVGLTFLLLHTRRFDRRGLEIIDAMSMCVVGFLVGCVLLPLQVHFRPELAILLLMAHILVGRAALVPSTTVRTALIGLASLLPILIATHVVVSRPGAPEWLANPGAQVFTAALWGLAIVVLSTVVTRVIYGLRRREIGRASCRERV